MSKTKFKLRSAISYNYFIMCLIGSIIIMVVGWALSPFGIEWLYCLLVALAAMFLPFIIALIDFCFFKPYYLIDKEGIKKFKNKKLILTVKREEIQEIICIKTSYKLKLLFPIWFIIGDFPGDKICIKFHNANDECDYSLESRYGLGTRNEDSESNYKSNTDLLSRKDVYKLAKLLNMDVH